MNYLWAVQQNLTNAINYQRFIAALEKNGQKYHPFDIIPFSDELPSIVTDLPVVAYGSTTLIKNLYRQKCWKPGIWFEPENFRTSVWLEKYGENLLNADARILPLNVLSTMDLPATFFLKPDNDLKDFSGEILSKEEFQGWYEKISAGGYLFEMSIPVVLSTPKYLGQEWRVIVIDGEAITGSTYRFRSSRIQELSLPHHVKEFVEKMVSIWQPAPVFVMDVCDCAGELKIIELNCFNGSGFYQCDIEKIIERISTKISKENFPHAH